jgi:alpha-mannosidase
MRSFITLLAPVAAIAHSLVTQEPQPAAAAPKPSPVREVIVIIKTHFDIGYTHRVREIVRHYRTDMIDRAMDIMDQSKRLPPEHQFAWTGPGWVMSKVLEDWDGQTPTRRQRHGHCRGQLRDPRMSRGPRQSAAGDDAARDAPQGPSLP